MAGTIIISTAKLMSMNTRTFDLLVERTRSHLPTDVLAAAYRPLDEGGMTFISLKELSSEQFQCFARAVDAASVEYRATGSDEYCSAWDELTGQLRKDPRSLR